MSSMAPQADLLLEEVGSIYVDAGSRFIVSFITGYGGAGEEEVTTPRMAAHWALELSRDAGSGGSRWFVFDRLSGEMHSFQQDEFEEDDDGS